MESVESQIAEWRAYVASAPGVNGHDVDELEDHLRHQIAELNAAGLTADEAFLIAVKRMGDVDGLSREFAREHSGRLWKQLVLSGDDEPARAAERLARGARLRRRPRPSRSRSHASLPASPTRSRPGSRGTLSLFVLPFLAAYFARRRQLDARRWVLTAAPFVLAALVVNLYPYDADSDTEVLVALHLPVVLWFVVAYPYMGGTIRSHERRMDFVRFTGEWFIYYVLIALGGGVLMGLTAAILEPTGVDVDRIAEWVLPSGAAGAVDRGRMARRVEAAGRREHGAGAHDALHAAVRGDAGLRRRRLRRDRARRRVRSRAPQRLRRPAGGRPRARPVRDVRAGPVHVVPDWMDGIQLVAVVSALVLDLMVLGAMIARIGDLGFTPNRTAALGLNLVLLVNLAGAAWLSARFLTGRSRLHRLERWQTTYLPVFALWAATVVVILPPLFAFD